MKKEDFEALVKSLNGLGLGACSGDAVHKLQPTRSGALLTSVLPNFLCLVSH